MQICLCNRDLIVNLRNNYLKTSYSINCLLMNEEAVFQYIEQYALSEELEEKAAQPDSGIVDLPVVSLAQNPDVLIFDVRNIRILREKYGILGVLTGTLAQYPQQNFFLSVPLKLFIWEVIWLVESGKARLVDQARYRIEKARRLAEGGRIENDNRVLLSKNEKHDNLKNTQENREPNFVVTKNTDTSKKCEDFIAEYEIPLRDYLNAYIKSSSLKIEDILSRYHNFKYLKEMGFFMNPGLKFGGDLVIYPGDPLRFHSYSIVKFNMVDLQDLVVGGRLATSVKKNIIILGDEENSSNDLNDNIEASLSQSTSPKSSIFH